MMPDAHEIEWQFDALDLRPVLRWLARLKAATAADGISLVANSTAT